MALTGRRCALQGPHLENEAPGQAKAGLEYLVRLQALALARRGVNVNAIVPGLIRTDAWSKVRLACLPARLPAPA